MIVYITAKAPYGQLGEAYILPEMSAIKEKGMELLIFPRDRSDELFHTSAKHLLDNTLSCPIMDLAIAKSFLKTVFQRPLLFLDIISNIVLLSRNIQIALKNLIVLPKSIYLSGILRKKKILHIHAHYGSTTSTMAYIISRFTGIPWSFTVHRWDIPENNLLGLKCKNAAFVRAIDKKGREEVIGIVNESPQTDRIKVIHVGVNVDCSRKEAETGQRAFTFLCPAMFVLKKGHKYLFEACKLLLNKGLKFKCLVAGDGPLKEEFRSMVSTLELKGNIDFLGPLSQESIFDLYQRGRIDAVVLPSIVTEDGEKEGIPVALMEAMAYAIPVVSTNTGGIPELLGDGSGILVKEKDPVSLAISIEKLMSDRAYCGVLGEKGRMKVEKDFNISIISNQLLSLFMPEAGGMLEYNKVKHIKSVFAGQNNVF